LKRSGGATIASIALWHSLATNTRAAAMECSDDCSFHDSACHWVKSLAVAFTAVQDGALTPDRDGTSTGKSGRIFSGTVTVVHRFCNESSDRTSVFSVATGGYTAHAQITGNDDSACPAGTTTTTADTNGGNIDGHGIAIPASTGRSGLEFHLANDSIDVNDDNDETNNYAGPLGSEGCIVLQSVADWNDFTTLLHNNDGADRCTHSPEDPIPTEISYDFIDPDNVPAGNEPG